MRLSWWSSDEFLALLRILSMHVYDKLVDSLECGWTVTSANVTNMNKTGFYNGAKESVICLLKIENNLSTS